MLALSFTFPAGRYHATPWDRHVNEGAVAWPPEPWRIIRGLIATWHHKIKPCGGHNEPTLRGLIESLSAELPEYSLPAASHSHTRHYMPQFASGKTSLVFDAFTAIRRDDPLTVVWPNVELPDDQRELLDALLSVMGYLGRAESWVEAQRLAESPTVNCVPGTAALDTATGEIKGEIVTLHAPMPAVQYQTLRQGLLAKKNSAKKLAKTLPDNLLDALSVDTADLRKHGWSQPPAARKVSYLRPVDALRPRYGIHHGEASRATVASFIVTGKPLPLVEDTVRIGELMRMAVMGLAGQMYGRDRVPAILSGHDMPRGNRHRHAFYLPWDSNEDGRIDRLLVYAADGMTMEVQRVLEDVNRLWTRGGNEWRLVLESIGQPAIAGALAQPSRIWRSVTPYLHPWHVKRHFDVAAQIKRECRERGLPEPLTLESFGEVKTGRGKSRHSIAFRRVRNHRGLVQPDRLGSFWRLTFPRAVQAPLALGFGCHFGLGLFIGVGED